MPSIMTTLILFFSILSITLSASVPAVKTLQPGPIHIHTTYTNPATAPDCNLECRRAFCISVSQFLESVTCTSHRPCLSLVLQYQIQEKCLNWRPEVHAPSTATIDGPEKSRADATKSKDGMDPDCMEGGPASPHAEWVKSYVPVAEVHAWEKDAGLLIEEQAVSGGVSCVVVLRWLCFVGVVLMLLYAWKASERKERCKEISERRVKGKGEM